MKNPFPLLDDITIKHCKNVAKIAMHLAGGTGLDTSLVLDAAIWHDAGKAKMLNIVSKTGRLSDEDFETIKQHPVYGCEIIKQKYEGAYPEDVARVALCHHKRKDGSGYPENVDVDQIDMLVQIIQIADVYEALTAKRTYKDAFTHDKAKNMIINGECGYFSNEVIRIFKALIDDYYRLCNVM